MQPVIGPLMGPLHNQMQPVIGPPYKPMQRMMGPPLHNQMKPLITMAALQPDATSDGAPYTQIQPVMGIQVF